MKINNIKKRDFLLLSLQDEEDIKNNLRFLKDDNISMIEIEKNFETENMLEMPIFYKLDSIFYNSMYETSIYDIDDISEDDSKIYNISTDFDRIEDLDKSTQMFYSQLNKVSNITEYCVLWFEIYTKNECIDVSRIHDGKKFISPIITRSEQSTFFKDRKINHFKYNNLLECTDYIKNIIVNN